MEPRYLSRIDSAMTRRAVILRAAAAGLAASSVSAFMASGRALGVDRASAANALGEFPQLNIVSTDDGLTLAGQIEAGRYLVTIENQATLGESAPNFILLAEGETAEAVLSAPVDPAVGMPDWFYTSTVVPAPVTPIGATAQAIVDFAAGHYAVAAEPFQPSTELDVVPGTGETAPVPEAEAEISIGDGRLTGVPDRVTAGKHIWQVTSLGDVPHRFQLFSYPAPVTRDQIVAAYSHLLAGTEPEAGLPDLALAVQLGGLGPMSGGLTGWSVVDLIPGQYIAMCAIQEGEASVPHGLEGEVAVFTVVSA